MQSRKLITNLMLEIVCFRFESLDCQVLRVALRVLNLVDRRRAGLAWGKLSIPISFHKRQETIMLHPVVLEPKDFTFGNVGLDGNHTRPVIQGFHDEGFSSSEGIFNGPGTRGKKPI